MKKISLTGTQKKNAEDILRRFRLGYDLSSLKNAIEPEKSAPYKNFSKDKDASYQFAKILDIPICPYCNENYTYTISYRRNSTQKFVVRPEFDHFQPKRYHADLQLDLMNLVPSCHVCNSSLKGQKKFDRLKNLHPYYDDFDSIMKFTIGLHRLNYLHESSFSIKFCKRYNVKEEDVKRAKKHIVDFELEDRYQLHKDEVVKILRNVKFYHIAKKKEIEKLLISSNLDTVILPENILFAEKNCDISKISLGKLKKDIIRMFIK